MNKYSNDKLKLLKVILFAVVVFLICFVLFMHLFVSLSTCSDEMWLCVCLSILISTLLTVVSLLFKVLLTGDF